ncbi:ABC transporter ATP-binding protein [Roseisolibacter agri]|uniref:ABC transporter n=1 Tax=Roseisolibacter agri TaxID=2014610 RepID=A0AA37QAA1_9BACT|nr:ABC transporter ATP-binding protein [Roseisolibacter agri]GLC25236.1 ABC transporter [Roseisolibacter agri]
MLEIRNLTKRFGRLDVLKGVDLAVRPGRVTAILGPNGAGKTTLIKSILGLTRPDGGQVLLGGETVVGAGARGDAYRARIGYMAQIARYPENLSAAELIAMLVELRRTAGADVAHDVARDESLIERFALAPHLDKPMRALSGGTRQKVNAVLAFLFRPELLILDEPTAGLDPVASSALKDRILAARDEGRTLVLTSHVMSELQELADDVAFLADGRVRFAGPVEELLRATRQPTLERAIAHLLRPSLEVLAA